MAGLLRRFGSTRILKHGGNLSKGDPCCCNQTTICTYEEVTETVILPNTVMYNGAGLGAGVHGSNFRCLEPGVALHNFDSLDYFNSSAELEGPTFTPPEVGSCFCYGTDFGFDETTCPFGTAGGVVWGGFPTVTICYYVTGPGDFFGVAYPLFKLFIGLHAWKFSGDPTKIDRATYVSGTLPTVGAHINTLGSHTFSQCFSEELFPPRSDFLTFPGTLNVVCS